MRRSRIVLADGNRIRVIEELAELAPIEDDWRQAAVAARNLFVTPEWFSTYLEHAPGTRPGVVLLSDADDRPLALLPLVQQGNIARFPLYGDRFEPVLLAPDALLGDVWRTLLGAVRPLFQRKLVILSKIDRALVSAAYGTRYFKDVIHILPYIELEGLGEGSWLASRSSNFRSEVRRKQRAMAKEGFDFVSADDPSSARAAIVRHFELHDRRWEAKTTESTLGTQAARDFHAAVSTRIAERGWLRLWFLQAGEDLAASWYGWNLGGRYAYYQAGFDPRWARHSPGTLLLARTVEAALAEGASEYDLLLGEERYKWRFANASRSVQSIALAGAPSLASARTYGIFALRHLHRMLPEGLQETTRRFVQTIPILASAADSAQ